MANFFVFVHGSFANSNVPSSQILFLLVLVYESKRDTDYHIHRNILHWSSNKCQRVSRSVLASELYAVVQGIDSILVINTSLQLIHSSVIKIFP